MIRTIALQGVGPIALLVIVSATQRSLAYVPGNRWTNTASGSAGSEGNNVTLTWSLLRDGTSIPGEGGSNLIDFFDDMFNFTLGGTNFATRPWFSLFQQSFDRWEALGGINFVYEPNDNNTALSGAAGSLGARGDIRIGGQNIDGSGSTLAYAYSPNDGDIVIDTSEASFYSNTANNYRAFRDTLMHEIGHAFGLNHVTSTSDALLMEPTINTAFDGPQLDDIRGIQGFYGDVLEKTNSGQGNNTSALAHSLGTLAAGGSLSIGSQAAGGQSVAASETDFVSIANTSDVDFYAFSVSGPTELDVTLTPWGGIFNQGGSSFNASARNDLSLAVVNTNGSSILATADSAPAGQVETLADVTLPNAGQYFIRVDGGPTTDNVQLYQLQLAGAAIAPVLDGDYNLDGVVTAADYVVWRKTFNHSGADLLADGSGNNVIDDADFTFWRTNFGESQTGGAGGVVSLGGVPEPQALSMTLINIPLFFFLRRARCIR
jgi:hypothetical protein